MNSTLATELDRNYIGEKNQLKQIVKDIEELDADYLSGANVLDARKFGICKKIPSKARAEFERKICG